MFVPQPYAPQASLRQTQRVVVVVTGNVVVTGVVVVVGGRVVVVVGTFVVVVTGRLVVVVGLVVVVVGALVVVVGALVVVVADPGMPQQHWPEEHCVELVQVPPSPEQMLVATQVPEHVPVASPVILNIEKNLAVTSSSSVCTPAANLVDWPYAAGWYG